MTDEPIPDATPSSDLVEETSQPARDWLAALTVGTFAAIALIMAVSVAWAVLTGTEAGALLGGMALGIAALQRVWGVPNGR